MLEPHAPWRAGALAEAEQVLGLGAGERVDGLARVADDADVRAVAEPSVEQLLLRGRDVLVLVDREEAVLLPHLGRRPAARDSIMPAVASSTSSKSMQAPLVLERLVDAAASATIVSTSSPTAAARPTAPLRVLGQRHRARLAELDLGGRVPQGRGVEPQPQALGGLRDEPRLAGRASVGAGAADHLRPEVVQLRERGRVEGAGRDAGRAERARAAPAAPPPRGS